MSGLAQIPGTLPSGTRRRRPKASQNRKVPLWTVEPDGEEYQTVIRVPTALSYTQEHTNERLRFNGFIEHWIAQWIDWRGRRGWVMTGEVEVTGPFEPPESDKAVQYAQHAVKTIGQGVNAAFQTSYDHGDEYQWFMAKSRFRRDDPLYVGLDDMLEFRHMALTYGVDPDRDKPLVTPFPEAKDHLSFDGGLDAMKVAEERRQRLGLNRKDFLFHKDVRRPL